jgi:hypothetical protein
MFLLFGTKKKVRSIPGGKVIREKCPSCGHDSQFIECEASSSLDFYFIDVLEDKKRVWVCHLCQEQFSVEKQDQTEYRSEPQSQSQSATPDPRPPTRSAPIRSAPIPSRAERAAMAKSSEIEDRLAALKKKMGPK